MLLYQCRNTSGTCTCWRCMRSVAERYLIEWVAVATGRSSSFSGSYLHSAPIHTVLLLHTVLCKFSLQFIQSSFSSSSNRTKNRLCSRLPTCQGHGHESMNACTYIIFRCYAVDSEIKLMNNITRSIDPSLS
jgi:hypothetical protein